MLAFLPEKKRKILLRYAFVNGFFSGNLQDKEEFLRRLKDAEPNLAKQGITKEDIGILRLRTGMLDISRGELIKFVRELALFPQHWDYVVNLRDDCSGFLLQGRTESVKEVRIYLSRLSFLINGKFQDGEKEKLAFYPLCYQINELISFFDYVYDNRKILWPADKHGRRETIIEELLGQLRLLRKTLKGVRGGLLKQEKEIGRLFQKIKRLEEDYFGERLVLEIKKRIISTFEKGGRYVQGDGQINESIERLDSIVKGVAISAASLGYGTQRLKQEIQKPKKRMLLRMATIALAGLMLVSPFIPEAVAQKIGVKTEIVDEDTIAPSYGDTLHEKRMAEREATKLLLINSDDPEEILEIIRQQDPESYEKIKTTRRVIERDLRWGYGDKFLQLLARATRVLYKINPSGMYKIDVGFHKTVLRALDFSMSHGAYTLKGEAWEKGIEFALKLMEETKKPDLFIFMDVLGNLAETIQKIGLNQEYYREFVRDPVILNKVFEITRDGHLKGLNVDNDFFGFLTSLHREMGGVSSEDFCKLMDFLYYNFYLELEHINVGLGMYGLKALRYSVPWLYGGDTDYILKSLSEGVNLTLKLSKTLSKRGERQLQIVFSQIEWRGTRLTEEFVEKILELHANYGILMFARLQKNDGDFELIDHLIENARSVEYQSNKPTALIITVREGGLIFDTFAMGNFIENAHTLMKGYNLIIHEVASDRGIVDACKMTFGIKGKKKIDVLVFAGHGAREGKGIAISSGVGVLDTMKLPVKRDTVQQGIAVAQKMKYKYARTEDEQYLDFSDADILKAIGKFIDENAKIILYSCETGKGGLKGENILRFIASILRGRTVYGPGKTITGVDYVLDQKGKVLRMIYFHESDDRYKIKTPIETYEARIAPSSK